MFRSGLMILTLFLFIIAVGFGVTISNEHFNRMVLPAQPIKFYQLTKLENGDLQVEIVGEKIVFNPQVALVKTEPYWQMAKQTWEKQLTTTQKILLEQWHTLQQSEQVRAVNQWVEEQVKERI